MKLIRSIAAFQACRSVQAAILLSLSLSAAPVLAVEEVDGVPVPIERPDAHSDDEKDKPGDAGSDPGSPVHVDVDEPRQHQAAIDVNLMDRTARRSLRLAEDQVLDDGRTRAAYDKPLP